MSKLLISAVLFLGVIAGQRQAPQPPSGADKSLPMHLLKLKPGFAIDVYASGVQNARQMALGERGTLFVGSRSAGKVHAVVDSNRDGKADRVVTIASGLTSPSGVAFRKGSLYVAEISRVVRYDDIESRLDKPPSPVVVNGTFPSDTHHGWKFIAFGPDDLLYVPVGAPCNVCERDDPRYASIMRMKPDGSGLEVFASGIRNTVGFDWHPVTRELWIAENGRDSLGDDVPGDELLVAPSKGLHFGFPYCHQGNVADPEFGKDRPCSEFTPPARVLDPHVAAIGMRFYTGTMFPPEYRNAVFVAEHGSWNRSQPIGYRVMVGRIEGGKVLSYEPFVEGWLRGIRRQRGNATFGDAFGRPADVLVMPDGALLISDDEGGVIYRVTYKK